MFRRAVHTLCLLGAAVAVGGCVHPVRERVDAAICEFSAHPLDLNVPVHGPTEQPADYAPTSKDAALKTPSAAEPDKRPSDQDESPANPPETNESGLRPASFQA